MKFFPETTKNSIAETAPKVKGKMGFGVLSASGGLKFGWITSKKTVILYDLAGKMLNQDGTYQKGCHYIRVMSVVQKKILTCVGGQKCQGTLFVAGGIFILFLGDVLQEMGENKPLRTKWRFWIDCAWRIRKGGKIVAGCYDDMEDICTKARDLKGATLVDIHHKNVSHDLELFFDNDMCIELFSDSTTNPDLWELRRADGYRYTLDKGLKIREWMSEPDGWEYERKGIDKK